MRRFHKSNRFVRGVMGPIGSGKSVGMCWEIMTRAMEQAPALDGFRYSRWAVVRNTFPELKSTTIKTWLDWFPEARFGKISFGSPITHALEFEDVKLEVLFMPLDSSDDIGKLLSLDLTGAWINEARELPKAVLDALTGRVGRYPKTNPETGEGASWSGVIMDTNPPDDQHWWYRAAEEEIPDGWAFFRQPGGLSKDEGGRFVPNPHAENVAHLPGGYGYYERLIPGKDENWIKAYVLGEYATVMDGKAIYAGQWNDRLHVADAALTPLKGIAILLGWDWGLTPSCIIAQMSPRGQLRVLDEIIGDDCGIRQFARDFVLPVLQTKYKGLEWRSFGDPAGTQRAQTDERTVFEELRDAGIHTMPAASNAPLARWEAVRYFLARLVGGEPAFLLDPRCKVLRKGFNGGYRFRRMQVGGADARYSETADKNQFSHPHDALQYLCLDVRPQVEREEKAKGQTNLEKILAMKQKQANVRPGQWM